MVTGGAAGIGRATATGFVKEGAKVAICDVNPEAGKTTAESLGPEATFQQVDVSDNKSVNDWVESVVSQYGQIDVLVNNAGITRDGLIMRMKEADWDAVLNVNLKSAFNCIKAVSKTMVKQRSGRIINLASVVGVIGNPGQANYSASKAGIVGLTKTVAREYAGRGITVNAVAPGFIETAMTDVLTESIKEEMKKVYSEATIDHSMNPRNIGHLDDADGFARIKGSCGDTMEIWIRVRDDSISHAGFLTDGCGTSIASGSMVTEMAKGKSIAECQKISQESVLDALGGLPEDSQHCALLAANTLKAAIRDHMAMKKEPWKRSYRKQ